MSQNQEAILKLSGVWNENFMDLKDEVTKSDEDNGDTWAEHFSPEVKEYFANVSANVKNKAMDIKVKLTTLKDRHFISKRVDDKMSPDEVLNFKLNFLSKLTSRVQILAEAHGHAIEFLRDLFNQIQTRIEKAEAKAEKAEQEAATIKDDIKGQVSEMSGSTILGIVDEETKEMKEEVKEMKAKVESLTLQNQKLTEEVDEARQREMKGNILLSSPNKPDFPTLMVARRSPDGSVLENASEMCRRLIKEKTGVQILESDVTACHRLKDETSYILRVQNRLEGSAWETLSAGMITGKKEPKRGRDSPNFKKSNLYLNFQLTTSRSALVKQAKLARQKQKLFKYSVNENGRITVVKDKPAAGQKARWQTVRTMEELGHIVGQKLPFKEDAANARQRTQQTQGQ